MPEALRAVGGTGKRIWSSLNHSATFLLFGKENVESDPQPGTRCVLDLPLLAAEVAEPKPVCYEMAFVVAKRVYDAVWLLPEIQELLRWRCLFPMTR